MKLYCGTTIIIMTLVIAAFVMSGNQDANAAFILELDDIGMAGTELSIPDNSALDSSSIVGVISYNGAVAGSVFGVNVTTGISKPIIGGSPPSNMARIDLNSVNVSSTGGGKLRIRLTDTDFLLTTQPSPPNHIMKSSIGGTTDGTVTLNQYLGLNNLEWEMGLSPGTHLHNSGAFSSTLSTNVNLGTGPFSLTEIVEITHTGAGQITSFDAESNVAVPEPTTMLLLGCGLVGLAGYGWRRRKQQNKS